MAVSDHRPATVTALIPLMAAVSVVFLVTGATLPVLPLHVHRTLGLGTFTVGIVAGSQFVAALGSRIWAGNYADRRGAKRAVVAGLFLAAASGAIYLASLRFLAAPLASVALLIVGRALLGAGESFVITGAQSWGLALASPRRAGRVIAWLGTAMYAALAIGAPVGTAIHAGAGFGGLALGTILVPALTLALVLPLAGAPAQPPVPRLFGKVARAVALPGLGLAFASVGFGAMTAFVVLLFVERGWQPAWLSFTIFALAFIAARLLFGGLGDRVGGARVAFGFAVIQATGLALLWAAPWAILGFVGAALTGFGYSLVYPGLAVEAVRRAPPEGRGLAIGVYTAFLDVALGLLTPVLGLLAQAADLGLIFLASAALTLCALPIAARLRHAI